MKKLKKLISLGLVLAMALSVCVLPAQAVNDREPEIPVECNSQIMPRASYQIINEAITQRGVDWQQPDGYIAYRVWVDNTTSETMTVTVTSAGGTFTETVPANSSKTILTVNNAWENETHSIDFQTRSGTVSGTVRVRVSDTVFS